MKWSGVLILMLTMSATSLSKAETFIRTNVPPGTPWVGQRVVLSIDVLSDTGWAKISRFGEVEIPGAYIKIIDSQGIRLNETINGQKVSGQRYEWSVFPQIEGEITIPQIPIDVITKSWGAKSSTSNESLNTPSVQFYSKKPPGAEKLEGLISTSKLTIKQSWEPSNASSFHVGDALKRSIIIEAVDIPGMAFVPLTFDSARGMTLYPAQAQIIDQTNRGVLTGRRTEQVTYVFQEQGKISIPDIEFHWWNINNSVLEKVVLEGRQFDIQEAVEYTATSNRKSISGFNTQNILMIIIVFGFFVFLVIRWLPPIFKKYITWKTQKQESEPEYYRRTIRAIKTGEPKKIISKLMRWLDKTHNNKSPALLHDFVDTYGDNQLKTLIKELLNNLDKHQKFNHSNSLIESLSRSRQRWQKQQFKEDMEKNLLPDLN
jgi:hypothetical protein